MADLMSTEQTAQAAIAALRDEVQSAVATMRAELQQLQATVHLYQQTLDLLPWPLVIQDSELQITYSNPAYQQTFGAHPPSTPTNDPLHEAAGVLAHNQTNSRVLTRRIDGKRLIFQTMTAPLHDETNRPAAVATTVQDLTALKQTEQRLRVADDRLSTFLSNVPMVLYAVDREGIVTLSEGKGLATLGLKPGQVVGQSIFEVFREVPEFEVQVRRALAGEQHTSITALGPTVFETVFAPLCDDNGEVSGMIGVSTDISTRVEIEQERVRMQEEIIRTQANTLAELSTPLIPINEHIVVMPLVGAMDSRRAAHVIDTLLHGVSRNRAVVAIIDITGVPVFDTQVAATLIQAAQSVKLLGSEVILTGIRPEVAQTLIGLGVDLTNIPTRSNLQSGIAYATGQIQRRR